MKLVIIHTWDYDVAHKDIRALYHSLITLAIGKAGLIEKDNLKKVKYSFKCPSVKQIKKGEKYYLEFSSRERDYINSMINLDFKGFILKEIVQKNNVITNVVKVHNLHYELSNGICKNWYIDTKGQKRTYYTEEHSLELLKELIEVQVNDMVDSEIKLNKTSITKHGKKYYSFIKKLEIVSKSISYTKNNNTIPSYTLLLEFEKSRNANKISNIIQNEGLGAKNSYGLGFVEGMKIIESKEENA